MIEQAQCFRSSVAAQHLNRQGMTVLHAVLVGIAQQPSPGIALHVAGIGFDLERGAQPHRKLGNETLALSKIWATSSSVETAMKSSKPFTWSMIGSEHSSTRDACDISTRPSPSQPFLTCWLLETLVSGQR